MVKETKQQDGGITFNLDYYDEFIYRMEKNEIKNLDQLNDFKVLSGKSRSIRRSKTSQSDLDSANTLLLNRKVIVKQYAPKTFEKIRELSKVTTEDLINSLDPSKNIKQISNAGLGAGASGSFFFFCFDKKFIMKTMS